MAGIPTDAPRSDDGNWWWDGSQWQPVAEASADGYWRWDGSQWQPVDESSGAGSDSSSSQPHESAAREYIQRALDGVDTVRDLSEVLEITEDAAGIEGGNTAVFDEFSVPIGDIASVVVSGISIADAYEAAIRIEEREGFCYGVMWQALDLLDQSKTFVDSEPLTAYELSAIWHQGIDQGRRKASETAVRNRVLLAIAQYFAQYSSDRVAAETYVLNEIFTAARDSADQRSALEWPQPADMRPV